MIDENDLKIQTVTEPDPHNTGHMHILHKPTGVKVDGPFYKREEEYTKRQLIEILEQKIIRKEVEQYEVTYRDPIYAIRVTGENDSEIREVCKKLGIDRVSIPPIYSWLILKPVYDFRGGAVMDSYPPIYPQSLFYEAITFPERQGKEKFHSTFKTKDEE